MTDEELATALNIPIELVAKLTPAKRRSYENLRSCLPANQAVGDGRRAAAGGRHRLQAAS